MRVSVALARAGRQDVVEIDLPEGSRVGDALRAAAVQPLLQGEEASALVVGIWSRRCGLDARLREGDRVEVYRPLCADPKAMRRARARVKPSTRKRNPG